MTSYIVSREAQQVRIEALAMTFEFAAWEPIHTEYSYKYLESDIVSLAADTGFEIIEGFTDSRHYFMDSLWRARGAHWTAPSAPPPPG